jgi:murein DD-endopeptidase MepM/ murein hydrolase activator NlpD
MERYSLIVMTGDTSPIRRIDLRKDRVRQAIWTAGIAAFVLLVGLVDYVRVRIEHVELAGLRVETREQREQITRFETTLANVDADLKRLQEFERKVRIIANLPGSAATGGVEITATDASGGDLDAVGDGADDLGPPAESGPGSAAEPAGTGAKTLAPEAGLVSPVATRVSVLRQDAERLGLIASARESSLLELMEGLEAKRKRLESTPAIWPTQGWLTSRFGWRISPFTGGRQFHAGIDVAGERGTDVIAPAAGTVRFAGKKGPLGQTVILDHGWGVQTHYGHADDLFVKRGETVARGQRIASLGSSGRSTGPHLHYSVEVKGKSVNPLDYIFD